MLPSFGWRPLSYSLRQWVVQVHIITKLLSISLDSGDDVERAHIRQLQISVQFLPRLAKMRKRRFDLHLPIQVARGQALACEAVNERPFNWSASGGLQSVFQIEYRRYSPAALLAAMEKPDAEAVITDGEIEYILEAGDHACALYLPVTEGSVAPNHLETARDVVAIINDLDLLVQLDTATQAYSSSIPSENFELYVAWIRVSDEELVLGYWGTKVNTSWDAQFRRVNTVWLPVNFGNTPLNRKKTAGGKSWKATLEFFKSALARPPAALGKGQCALDDGDLERAREYWEPLAAKGCAEAFFCLGKMYSAQTRGIMSMFEGEESLAPEVTANYLLAVAYMRAAASQGYVDAQRALAIM